MSSKSAVLLRFFFFAERPKDTDGITETIRAMFFTVIYKRTRQDDNTRAEGCQQLKQRIENRSWFISNPSFNCSLLFPDFRVAISVLNHSEFVVPKFPKAA